MPTNKLTAAQVKAAHSTQEKGKLFDGGRLYLKDGKYWRQDYKYRDKNKTLSHGVYPDVSLAEARSKRDTAKTVLARGIDPGVIKRQLISDDDRLEAVTRDWYERNKGDWVPDHAGKVIRRFELYIFPKLGNVSVSEVQPIDLLECLRFIEERGKKETAKRTRSHCSRVFRYAIATGKCAVDPAAGLSDALAPPKSKPMAFTTDPETIAGLLRASETYQGTYPVQCALRMAPHVFVRPINLRMAEWSEIDFNARVWTIPADKMKMRDKFIIPLSTQVMGIIEDLKLDTFHRSKYLFPGERDWSRPMSSNTILAALRMMGFDKDVISGHGFRHMASTILHENQFEHDWIELQLAHDERKSVSSRYNYATHIEGRTEMMQWWSDYLDGLRDGSL